MKGYREIIKSKNNLKNSEKKAKGIFSLPLYPELKNSEIEYICKKLKLVLKNIS